MQQPQRNIARQIVEALLQCHGHPITARQLYSIIRADSRRVSDTLSVFEALDLINRKQRQYMLPSADEVERRHGMLFQAPYQSSQQAEYSEARTISALAVCVIDACREQSRTIVQLRDALHNSRRIYDAMNVLMGLGVLENNAGKIQICQSLWWHQPLKDAERPMGQVPNYLSTDVLDKSLRDLEREALESLSLSQRREADEMTKNPAIGATPKRSQGYCFKSPLSDGFK